MESAPIRRSPRDLYAHIKVSWYASERNRGIQEGTELPRKFAVITALTLGAVMSGAGVASAGDTHTHVGGGDGFASSPVVVNAPQAGVLIVNGTLVDGRCIAPWANGAIGDAIASNTDNAQCNTGKIDQSHNAPYRGGFLF